MKKKLITLFVLLFSIQGFAQSDALYSQYMYNQFVINPAYAGSRNSMSAMLMHRSRWVGIDNAPSTSTFSFQTPLTKSNFAFGLNVAADKLGASTNLLVGLTAAYHLKLSTGKLAFALRGGFYGRTFNGSRLEYKNINDPLFISEQQSSTRPALDFGVYYYTKQFYVSLALNHLGGGQFNYELLPEATFDLRQYNTLGVGYAFKLNNNIVLKPSILLKQSQGFDPNIDFNLSALFYKRLWVGVSVRSAVAMSLMLDVNVTDNIRMGYAYDIFFNSLSNASRGAHEFFIGFDFGSNGTEIISPRFL